MLLVTKIWPDVCGKRLCDPPPHHAIVTVNVTELTDWFVNNKSLHQHIPWFKTLHNVIKNHHTGKNKLANSCTLKNSGNDTWNIKLWFITINLGKIYSIYVVCFTLFCLMKPPAPFLPSSPLPFCPLRRLRFGAMDVHWRSKFCTNRDRLL